MKVLVVGAGAVGQVYGYYFHLGGCEVTFLVREKYQEEVAQGMTFFHLNKGKNPDPIFFKKYSVISNMPDIQKTNWDLVLITLPSDALYTPWLGEFASQVNRTASIISLQPGTYDRGEICKYFSSEKVISGMITLIAFSTPLDNEGPQTKGMAYWFPPVMKAFFDGEKIQLDKIVTTLKKGGFPATKKSFLKNPSEMIFASTFLTLFIRILEINDWKLNSFNRPEVSTSLKVSTQEAFKVISNKFSVKIPWIPSLLSPFLFSLVIRLSLWLMPFDLETYLKIHFTKVGVQMKRNRLELLNEAQGLKLSIPMLEKLG
jgi:hypothetical protein